MLFLVLGCSVYDPSLIEPSDGTGVPPRPSASTSSPDDGESFAFALKDIFLRQSAEMAASIGVDLDATTTTGPDDATCVPRAVDGEVVSQDVVDGDMGIDNAIGVVLLPTTASALPCLEDNLAMTQGRGIGTILLWVRDWNGLSDDASVTAVLTTAVDGTSEHRGEGSCFGGTGVREDSSDPDDKVHREVSDEQRQTQRMAIPGDRALRRASVSSQEGGRA